ncbi:MAG: DUF4332 domain-containing protein, partial [Methanomassiliicoccus sp.]|nr:DUF4332 domain-containing protein [Methanomassiliicoccus sp.]
MTKMTGIKGIKPECIDRLSKAGIETLEKYLEVAGPTKGRDELAKKTGIKKEWLLEWANHADLFRIKGVASEYADLLEAAGVDSCAELAQRKAPNLTKKIEELNGQMKLVKRTPTEAMVEDWIAQAKKQPKVVT